MLKDVDIGVAMTEQVRNNLRFVDDIAATAENQQDLTLTVDNVGAETHIDKTEIHHVGLTKLEMNIVMRNQNLNK